MKTAGFSLVELAIVVGIAGLLTVTFAEQYKTWNMQKTRGDTEARRMLVTNAMTLFLTSYGRLPCPADPSLPPTAATAGYEVCLGNFPTTPYQEGAVHRVTGRRDTAADADANLDPVLIGAIPYAAMGLSARDAVDGWGNKMTYAVSEYLTRKQTFNDQYGVIGFRESYYAGDTDGDDVIDDWTVMPPVNSTNPDVPNENSETSSGLINAFMLAIVSHGPDGKGAYSQQGVLGRACDTTMASGRDNENCNRDALFIKASRTTGIYSERPGANYYDDAFTVFTIRRDSDKWMVTGINGMQNKTSGRVGIGTPTPQAKLDIGGNVAVNNYWAETFCSPDGNCFRPTRIAGTMNDNDPENSAAFCGSVTDDAFGLVRGMNGAATRGVDCAGLLDTTGIVAATCATGQFLAGIDASGGIICASPF